MLCNAIIWGRARTEPRWGACAYRRQFRFRGMVYASAIDARGKPKGARDNDDDDDDDNGDDVRSCFTPSPLR